jgi:hypothetical protein
MHNPWLKKNPFLSLWLSAFNSVLGTWRGHALAQGRRQTQAAIARATQDPAHAWWATAPKPAAKKRRKKRTSR